jgi:galactokinase
MPAIGLTIADWVIILIYFAFVLGIGIFGRPRSVLKLDCRSLEHASYPFDRDDLRIVLCDTRVKRELASSEYNVRRSLC